MESSKPFRKCLCVLGSLLSASFGTAVCEAQTNGSFESGFTGWTLTGNAFIESQSSPDYTATDGIKMASFNGSSSSDSTPNAVLAQAFATTAGTTYTLAFDMGVIGTAIAEQKLQVTVDGTGSLLSQVASRTKTAGSAAQWAATSYTFTANSATTTLTFRDISTVTTGIDALLDNVRVTIVNPGTAPVTVNDSATIHAGRKVRLAVLANDSGSITPSAVQIVSPPGTGTATVLASGEILYAHSGVNMNPVSFTYRVSGSGGQSQPATVNITVSASMRIPNSALNVPAAPPTTAVQVVPAFPGVTFTEPNCFVSPPGDAKRLFVCEMDGRIKVIPDVTAATPTSSLVLNLAQVITTPPRTPTEYWPPMPGGEEAGLLGMAFHPNYASNGYFYVAYHTVKSTDPSVWYQRLSRFTIPAAQIGLPAPVADPASEKILIEQRDRNYGHNASAPHFGADGYLYMAIGDEGNEPYLQTNGQRIEMNFFGAMLRIDVDKKVGNREPNAHPNPAASAGGYSTTNSIPRDEIPAGSGNYFARYSIPIDNPYVSTAQGGTWNGVFNNIAVPAGSLPYVRSEFWAVGLRSPWRFSIDKPTGEIWVGDVGQEVYEEVHTLVKGGNYGWPYRDGNHAGPRTPTAGFTSTPPLYEYVHTQFTGDSNYKGNCIIGGVVYRGTRFASLTGAYIFGDHLSGHIWALTRPGGVTTVQRIAGQAGLTTFGTDPSNGDVLVSDYFGGRIMRIITTTTGAAFPATLSATGLFADLTDLSPAPGVLPYDVNLPFWSDYAVKRRWFVIPDGTSKMVWSRDGSWTFPTGEIWVKHFDLETERGNAASPKKRIETRLLVKNASGSYGVSYRWNAAGTDATLAADGGEDFPVNITVNGAPYTQQWSIPSRSQCITCHSPQAGHALSVNTRQINMPSTMNGFAGNQLDLLHAHGYFSNTPESSNVLPRHVRPDESSQSLEARVRSYLAINCAYCHAGAAGTAPAVWDGRHPMTLAQTGLINGHSTVAPAPYKLIVPGGTANSVVLRRMGATGGFTRMPPLGTSEIDRTNVALVTDWITNLADNVPPVIQLVGANPLVVSVGAAFVDPGATATDNLDGSLTSKITVTGGPVVTSAAGSFALSYRVSDAAGNAALTVTRTVNVVNVVNGIGRDLNRDGNADLLFQNAAGQIVVWYMNGAHPPAVIGSALVFGGVLGDWKVVGAPDLNADGAADLLFQNAVGNIAVWYMNGAHPPTVISSATIFGGATGDWRVVGTPDLNADGAADLLFQNAAGSVAVWYMNGASPPTVISSATIFGGATGDWKVVGAPDLNADGTADLLFQNAAGNVAVWYMNGASPPTVISSATIFGGATGDWRVVGTSDLNGDGNADLHFQNNVGQVVVWYMNGSGVLSGSAWIHTGGLGDWRVR